jgi:predicted RNA-binding protein YlqC (UPF0109 family)
MMHDPARQAREELACSMKSLVLQMAKALVDSPDSVSVEAETENESTVLILQVAPTDLGKVIGKQGRTARSIRTILGAASMKAQHRFALDIRQEGGPPRTSTHTGSSPDLDT